MLRHKLHHCHFNPAVVKEFGFCKFCGKCYSEKRYGRLHEKDCSNALGGARGCGRGRGKGGRRGKVVLNHHPQLQPKKLSWTRNIPNFLTQG